MRHNCIECEKNYPDPCSKHCPEEKKGNHLPGQKCENCGTYFRGDTMG